MSISASPFRLGLKDAADLFHRVRPFSETAFALARFREMPSSVIHDFAYDETDHRLDVRFVSGRLYCYHEVPARLAAAMKRATSKGRFFNRRIRDHFTFTRGD